MLSPNVRSIPFSRAARPLRRRKTVVLGSIEKTCYDAMLKVLCSPPWCGVGDYSGNNNEVRDALANDLADALQLSQQEREEPDRSSHRDSQLIHNMQGYADYLRREGYVYSGSRAVYEVTPKGWEYYRSLGGLVAVPLAIAEPIVEPVAEPVAEPESDPSVGVFSEIILDPRNPHGCSRTSFQTW